MIFIYLFHWYFIILSLISTFLIFFLPVSMDTGHSCEHLLTKLWVPNPDYDPNAYSTSSSSSSVQVDLKILWQVEDALINISSDGATSIINISIVEKLAIQVPSFDYQVFMSILKESYSGSQESHS